MKLVILFLLVTCLVVLVASDGYGGHSYPMVIPMGGGGGKGRKWRIRAKGKGMQNMYPIYHHGGGGDYKKKEEHHQEVVYYPVPIYTPSHESHEEYKPKEEHKVDIIPIHMGGGYGGYGGYGGGGMDAGSLIKLLSMAKGY